MKPLLFGLCVSLSVLPPARGQDPSPAGQAGFERNCGVCHGGDGLGGEMGPNIANRLARFGDDQLAALIHDGLPNRGMPGFPGIAGEERAQLLAFLRTIRPRRTAAPVRKSLELQNGGAIEGLVLNESPLDVQVRTADHRMHLLRPAGGKFRAVSSQTDWTTYNG